MEIKAFGKNILGVRELGTNLSAGGIVLPRATDSKWFKILEVGPEVNNAQLLTNGFALVCDYSGCDFEVDGETFSMIHQDDILAYKPGE